MEGNGRFIFAQKHGRRVAVKLEGRGTETTYTQRGECSARGRWKKRVQRRPAVKDAVCFASCSSGGARHATGALLRGDSPRTRDMARGVRAENSTWPGCPRRFPTFLQFFFLGDLASSSRHRLVFAFPFVRNTRGRFGGEVDPPAGSGGR